MPRCEAQRSSTPDSEHAGARRSILRTFSASDSATAETAAIDASEWATIVWMLGKRCSTARVACAYSVIVAREPGEAPCPGASKHIADSPLSSAAATTVDIVVLSAPHPWSARTVGSSLPHTYTAATLGTPASSTRLAPKGHRSSGKLPRPRVLTKMFVCT